MTMHRFFYMYIFSFLYHCRDFDRTGLYIWVTRGHLIRRIINLLTLREQRGSHQCLVGFVLFIVLALCAVLCFCFVCLRLESLCAQCCQYLRFSLKFIYSLQYTQTRLEHFKYLRSYSNNIFWFTIIIWYMNCWTIVHALDYISSLLYNNWYK